MALDKNSSEKTGEKCSRRDFINKTAKATAGVTVAAGLASAAKAAPYKSILPASVLGANERILTGHIGTGGMGRANLGFVLQRDDMQPIAISDLWYRNMCRAKNMAESKFPEGITYHHDFREVIENKDVDAIVCATPDHWHCLVTQYAADAGKDIYCEKPLCTFIAEGHAMIEAIKRNNVVFQGGTMQRSGTQFQEAVKLVQDGYIGKVARVECYIHDEESIEGIGMGDDNLSDPLYEGCDWTFHQGWVEHKPFNTNRWIYNFRWFLDYSGGKITDWGAHLIDIAIWGMGQEKQPKSITAQGAKLVMQDNRTTPDTLEVLWEYDDYILSFSNRVWNQYLPEGYSSHGILFHGTLGTLRVDRGGYQVYPTANNGGCEPKKAGGGPMNEPHWQNFADCIRSREKPICDVETLFNTTRTCHLGTCAYISGGKVQWDSEKGVFYGSDTEAVKKANDWATREYKNGWSLKAPYDQGAEPAHTTKKPEDSPECAPKV